MKLVEKFKKQPKIIQVLDIAFIICFIYEIIRVMQNQSLDYGISSLMLLILFINSVMILKN